MNKNTPTYEELERLNHKLQKENQNLKKELDRKNFPDNKNNPFLEIIPQMVSYTNKKLVYEYVNKSYERHFHIKAQDIIGKSLKEIVGEKVINKAKNHIHKVLNGQEVRYIEKFEYPGGMVKYIEGHLIPDIGGSDDVRGYWAILNDITEKKVTEHHLQRNEKKFRSLYENAPLPYQSLDENGNILDVNPAWLIALGYDQKQVIGKNFSEFLHPDYQLHFEINFPQFKKTGHIHDIQFKLRHKHGHYLNVSFEGCVGHKPDGSFLQTFCVFKDITEQKEAEEAYRTLVENSLQGLVILQDNKVVFANSAIEDITGYSVSEFKQMSWEQVTSTVYQDDKNRLIDKVQKLITGEVSTQQVEFRITRKDGKILWVETFTSVIQYKGSSAVQIVYLDITGRKWAEKALKESENQKKLILNSTSEIIAYYDRELRIIWSNRGSAESVGKTPEELVGLHCYEIWHQRKVPCENCPVLEARNTKSPCQGEQKTPDGRFWNIRGYPVFNTQGEVIALAEFGRDITEQKKMELALKESEEKFRMLVESAPISIMLLRKGKYIYGNPEALKLLGYKKPEDIAGLDALRTISSEFRDIVTERLQRTKSGKKNPPFEVKIIKPDGKPIWTMSTSVPVNIDGKITTIIAGQDITVYKQTLEALRDSENRYRTILRTAMDGFWITDKAGKLLEVNESYCRMCGYSREELLKMTVYDLEAGEKTDETDTHLNEVKNNGTDRFESKHKHKNGHVLHVEVSIQFLSLNGGRYVSFIRDITEIKRNQSERDITLKLLKHLNSPNNLHELIRQVTALMHEWSGCEAVAIRLKEGEDFPYFETCGFPAEFVKAENSLCARDLKGELIRESNGNPVLECMCGNVICRRFDPNLPFFTKNGSFWTNSTTELLASTSEEDRQARTRNRCQGEGYESVALIPLNHGHETLGLLQFNDSKKNCFSEYDIVLFERLATNLALGLAQRRDAQNLKDSEDKFSRVFHNAPLLMTLSEFDKGTYLDVNEAFVRVTGYTKEQAIGASSVDLGFIKPEDKSRIKNILNTQDRISQLELELTKADGSTLFCLYSGELIEVDGKKRLLSIANDITELKLTEDALRESEELFRKAFDTEMIAMAISRRKDGVYIEVNPGFLRMTGYTRDQIIGRTSLELNFFTPDLRKQMTDQISHYGRLHNQELLFPTKNGEQRTILFSIGPITLHQEECLLATMVDITDRKNTELALKINEEKYRTLFDNAPLGIFRSTPEGRFIEMNRALASLLGYDSPEQAMNNITDIASQVYVKTNQREKILRTENLRVFENVYKDKCGKQFTALLYLKAVRDDKGDVLYLEGMVEDVTERKMQEEIVRESEIRYKKLMEEAPVGIALYLNNQLEQANKKFSRILGCKSLQTFTNESIIHCVHQDDYETVKSRLTEMKNNSLTYPLETNYRIKKKNGEIRHIAEFISEFKINKKTYIQSIIQDITDIFEVEESKKRIANEAAYIERKLQLLKQAQYELTEIIKDKQYEIDDFHTLFQLFKNEIETDKHWHIFNENFESLHKGFFDKLTSISPKLTQQDLKHCAFIKMNFETKEIATMFNVKPTSVQISRVRLKKKLGLSHEEDLIQFILKI